MEEKSKFIRYNFRIYVIHNIIYIYLFIAGIVVITIHNYMHAIILLFSYLIVNST